MMEAQQRQEIPEELSPQSECVFKSPIKQKLWAVSMSRSNYKRVPSSVQLRNKLKPHDFHNK